MMDEIDAKEGSQDKGSEKPHRKPQYLVTFCASLGILSVGTCLGYSSPAGFQLREDESTTNSSSVRASPLGINLLHFPLQTSDHSEAGLIQTNIYNYRTLNDSESGDNIVFNDDLTLTTSQLSWFSSSFNLGALVGGLISSPMMNFIGRRGSMIVSLIPSTAGWLLLGFGVNFEMLLSGRIFTGVFTGIACASFSTYIGEIASPDIRGALGNSFQFMLAFGIAYVYIFGSFTSWYVLAFICWVPPTAFSISMIFWPESPSYLLSKGKECKATKSYTKLRGKHYDPSEELSGCKKKLEDLSLHKFTVGDLKAPHIYKPFFVVIILMAFQQLCGINALTFNLATIFADTFRLNVDHFFQKTGGNMSENTASILSALVETFSAIPGALLIESRGRKFLLIVSSVTMGICQASVGLYFYLLESDEDWTVKYLSWLPLVAVIAFMFAFSIGFGSVPWIFMGELFPLEVRETASAISTSFSWTAAFFVIYSFEYLMVALKPYGFFWLFSGFCWLGLLYTIFFVPETKGKTLEEITQIFGKKEQN